MTDEARELASLLLREPLREPTVMLQGVVSNLDSNSGVSVYLSGSTFPIAGVHFLDSYSPRVNDVVWIAKTGPDLIIVGKLQDDPYNIAKSWNMGWGEIASTEDNSSPAYAALAPTLIQLSSVPLIGGRNYRCWYSGVYRASTNDQLCDWSMQWDGGGGFVGIRTTRSAPARSSVGTSTDTMDFRSRILQPGADGTFTFRVVGSRTSGTGTTTLTAQQQLAVYDVGPTTPI